MSAWNINCTNRHRQLSTCKILFVWHQSFLVKLSGQTSWQTSRQTHTHKHTGWKHYYVANAGDNYNKIWPHRIQAAILNDSNAWPCRICSSKQRWISVWRISCFSIYDQSSCDIPRKVLFRGYFQDTNYWNYARIKKMPLNIVLCDLVSDKVPLVDILDLFIAQFWQRVRPFGRDVIEILIIIKHSFQKALAIVTCSTRPQCVNPLRPSDAYMRQ